MGLKPKQVERKVNQTNSNNEEEVPSKLEPEFELPLKEEKDEDLRNVLPHFKFYTNQDWHMYCEKAKWTTDIYDDGVYKGPIKVKELNLAEKGETPKPMLISLDLTPKEEQLLVLLLKEYNDCFAWSYEYMKGVPPEVL